MRKIRQRETGTLYPPFAKAEKCLKMAIRILVIGEGDIRERIKHAWDAFYVLRVEDLPERWRPVFEEIEKRLIKYPPAHTLEGRIDASVRRMKRRTAVKMADHIWDMYYDVQRRNERARE